MFVMGSFLALLRLKKKSVVQNTNQTVPNEYVRREEYRQDRERRRIRIQTVKTFAFI